MEEPHKGDESRRDFVMKAAWVAPVVLSLAATPAWARTGSGPDPEPTPGPRQE